MNFRSEITNAVGVELASTPSCSSSTDVASPWGFMRLNFLWRGDDTLLGSPCNGPWLELSETSRGLFELKTGATSRGFGTFACETFESFVCSSEPTLSKSSRLWSCALLRLTQSSALSASSRSCCAVVAAVDSSVKRSAGKLESHRRASFISFDVIYRKPQESIMQK